MTPNEYQKLAKRTLLDVPTQPLSPEETMIIWNAVGLAGEAGEIVDYLKKGIFHRHGYDSGILKGEIGDLLWYAAGLATQHGFTLEEAMEFNIAKLKNRYPDGFSTSDSINRGSDDAKSRVIKKLRCPYPGCEGFEEGEKPPSTLYAKVNNGPGFRFCPRCYKKAWASGFYSKY